MWRLMALWVVLGVGITDVGIAEEKTAASSDLQQLVEHSANQFIEAYEQQDAAAIGKLFTAEAEYVNDSGMIFHGRAAIESEFAAAFKLQSPGKMNIELISIRPIAEGVLVEDGLSSFMPEAGGPMTQTRYTATHVQQADGHWLMASVRELDAGKMTPHDRLLALSWLLGGWHEDVNGSVISTDWKWSDNGNYLLSEFSVRQSPTLKWTGTHRIAWDAERKQFRSWIFESNGETADGWWRPNEDGSWSVSLSGVDIAGRRRASMLTYLQDGNDAIVVSHDQRIVDGHSLPGSVHRVVRQPPALEKSALPNQE